MNISTYATIHQNKNRKTDQTAFGSKNFPIEPFTIQTTNGPLIIEELTKKEITDAAKFSVGCNMNSIPSYQKFYKDEYVNTLKNFKLTFEDFKNLIIKTTQNKYQSILDGRSKNNTILVAKDTQNKINALFTLRPFNEFENNDEYFIDKKTAYIEECLVTDKYRGQGIGTIMLNNLLKTAEGHYSDVFLESENTSVSLYERAGFKKLDTENPIIKTISDYILKNRNDKEEITLMSKCLDNTKPWWARIIKRLK